jgi:hypothetical protein
MYIRRYYLKTINTLNIYDFFLLKLFIIFFLQTEVNTTLQSHYDDLIEKDVFGYNIVYSEDYHDYMCEKNIYDKDVN